MTKGDNINLFSTLNKLGKLTGVKFAYAVARNLAFLKPEYEALQEAVKPTEDFVKYEEERVELAKEYAKKDAEGKPISENNAYVLEDKETFDVKFIELKKKHKKTLEAREAQLKEQEELLKTDSTLVLYKVKIEDVPKDITVAQMNSILEIVED
ncbi:MAG: hypothetical protein WC735_04825 [Candidatus Paceibacterota bacterium]|jgi:hypothetical protein